MVVNQMVLNKLASIFAKYDNKISLMFHDEEIRDIGQIGLVIMLQSK